MLTETDIYTTLRDCYDPTLPCNIVDLGLIRAVTLTPDLNAPGSNIPGVPQKHLIQITLTLTNPTEASEAQPGAPHPDSGIWVHRLRTFGEKAGLAFQIIDDVLDMTQSSEELGKTAGKDTASIKATWPAVYGGARGPQAGIAQSRKDANELIADAFAALEPFGEAATPLKSLAQYLVERTN